VKLVHLVGFIKKNGFSYFINYCYHGLGYISLLEVCSCEIWQ